MKRIRKAAVIGSGVMGSSIAAHLVNVGIPTTLLDIVPNEVTAAEKAKGLTLQDKAVRNRIVNQSLKSLTKQKPAALTVKENIDLITVGNLEDDLEALNEVDWIIEVVVENLEVKKKVFEKVDAHRKPGTIVSSNTSGISIHDMSADCSDDFKAHFLGTHFFNPPRYLKLLEIIPTEYTKNDVVEYMKTFGEDVLGKGVVVCKDTPNFIANRIGTYGLQVTVEEMIKGGFTIGEIDSVSGPLIGRPKSATFRTLDVVGLDTFVHVANNVREQVSDESEKAVFEIPDFIQTMVEKGWIGSKAKQGFYLKKGKDILQLNYQTLEYEPRNKLQAPSMLQAKQLKSTRQKIKALAYSGDQAGEILWPIFKRVFLYAAEKYKEIADRIYDIDLAMKWGFGWELGPFETWDALGLETSVERMKKEGEAIPDWIEEMLAAGHTSFYKEESGGLAYYAEGKYLQILPHPKTINLKLLKRQDRVIMKNAGASLIDIGDDVACLEFTSPNNALGLDVLQMIQKSIEEVEKNYKGLVIGNQGKNFCVGANIALMLMEAQDDNFFELDMVVRQFHKTMMQLKYAERPVVVAPFSMALGGGVEVSIPASGIQASMETYMGFVEFGVGLIPGGGGNKELYFRYLDRIPEGVSVDLTKITNQVFELIATAKVSTSGEEAKKLGFLRPQDGISVNGDHLIHDAKQRVLNMFSEGYTPPIPRKFPVSGEAGYAAMIMGVEAMRLSGYASDHDVKIAKKLATVLSGGNVPQGTLITEQYMLDLEREAFLSLLGEPKTQARMQHMLMKGKPLRN
ncbi:3-hydroxyacyl-CoA dehydrogenase [Pullulanibacillus pueri]|uniref:Enoyl-CoA hydratase n=1 Tax=Pullulanibacillus pueri TaxID=1437324 RepID=A0A8J2ZSV3_9BACL|nr:3-hydroxyacyl-CoA dehydrogenase/enoyl-CoA hydratase family protein [Pullulanibacillus pueri]MBM7680396.1 3-hydroxyacyl-CoA dehydrogenase [Pullulanibacillus pueri]GGH75277.1 enoyl-CoA hydratase [Pullulanibacillus pueri]